MQHDQPSMSQAGTDLVPVATHHPVPWRPSPPIQRWTASPRKQARIRKRTQRLGLGIGLVYAGMFAGVAWMTGRLESGGSTEEWASISIGPSSPPSTFAPIPPTTQAVMTGSATWPISTDEAALNAGSAVRLQGGAQEILVVPESLESVKQGSVIGVGSHSYVVGRTYTINPDDWAKVRTGVPGVVLVESSGDTRRVVESWR